MDKKLLTILYIAIATVVAGCKKDNSNTPSPYLSMSSGTSISFTCSDPAAQKIQFKANCGWKVEIPSSASWLKAEPASGDAQGNTISFTVTLTATPSSNARKAEIAITYGDNQKVTLNVSQSSLHQCSDPSIPDDMVFSTTLGHNTTNVAQGFDYDPEEDVIYITQKYGAYRNHIGWQKRETKSGTTVAPNFMTLACFSHGNNISIEKNKDGKKYVWAPNYGTRQSDGSYDSPLVVSRFPLSNGQTLYNTNTTENYYFGLDVTWPAFDFENDMVAVCNYKKFFVYRLSEIMALPEEDLTIDKTITYGGVVGDIDSKIPEWTGKPKLKARDCRKVKPLYTVTFDYSSRKLHWQTYCIDNGWIFAILQADKKTEPDIIFDTYVEAYKMDGSKNVYKVRQEYMQNRERILQFGWTEKDYFYCEPEGIKVKGDEMLLLYTIKGKDSKSIRRPVIFRLQTPVDR